METNVGKRTYFTTEALAEEINRRSSSSDTAQSTGLLAPVRRRMPNTNGVEENPAYRVATYFNTIRQKRMELQNGRTTV